MSDLAKTLNAEIRRLARSEAKALATPLHKALSQLRRQVWRLSRDGRALSRLLAEKAQRPAVLAEPAPEIAAKGRISPRLVAKLRARLGLSLSEFALLLGVNSNSIFNWEHGKSRPSRSLRARLIAARPLGKREARRLVAAGQEGKAPKKRTRK